MDNLKYLYFYDSSKKEIISIKVNKETPKTYLLKKGQSNK